MQLAILRRFPKIRTRCCSQKMCFKCKVKGWHTTLTCEERQRRFLSIDAAGIQPCPTCGVPTQKTEGCNEVSCVCGHTWSWREKASVIPGGVPAVSVAPSLPEFGPELLKCLVRYRADVSSASQDGWGIFHHAAAQRQRMEPRAGNSLASTWPPHSDSSRLEALLRLGGDAAALMDVADNDGDTALSVAVAHDNIDGARFLVKKGVAMHPEVLASLRDFASPRVAAEACEVLRQRVQNMPHSSGRLWFWVEVGLIDRVREALAAGDPVETDSAAAIVLLRATFAAGAQVKQIAAVAPAIEQELQRSAEACSTSWSELRRSGATALARREVRLASSEHRPFDVELLKALLAEKADPQATVDMSRAGEGGHRAVPLVALAAGTDMRPQQGAEMKAMKLLLEASASANAPDSVGDTPLWWAMSRPNPQAVQLLVSHGAVWPAEPENCRRFVYLLQRVTQRSTLRDIASALSPLLADAERHKEERSGLLGLAMAAGAVPLWLRLLGPGAASASREAAVKAGNGDDQAVDEAAAAVALLLGGSTATPLEVEVRRCSGEKAWKELEQSAATALLLKELRGAHEYDRDLDLDLIKMLLRKGANANASQQSASLFRREWEEEDYTPLVLLANACGVPAASAAAAVEMLVEYMADVEQVDSDGDNALAWAVMKQNAPVVEALVKAGATLGQSLVEEEGSPLAVVTHPAMLRPIAEALGPTIRTVLEDFPSPPLWLLVQFGTPEAVMAVLSQGTPHIVAADVEALLRRRTQGGGLVGGALGGGSPEDLEVATVLRAAAIRQHAGPGQPPEAAARLWKTLLSDAATALLRQEVEGAFDGTFSLDLGFVEALLASGAEPNLQVAVGEEEEEVDEDSDGEFMEEEDAVEEEEEEDLDLDLEEEEEEEEEDEDDEIRGGSDPTESGSEIEGGSDHQDDGGPEEPSGRQGTR